MESISMVDKALVESLVAHIEANENESRFNDFLDTIVLCVALIASAYIAYHLF